MEPAVAGNRKKCFDLIDFHKSPITVFYLFMLIENIYQHDIYNQFD